MDESEEKSLLITGDEEGVIKVWESSTGREVYTVNEWDNELVYLKLI